MWVGTLMGEEIVDVMQREMIRDERVQPLVRQVSKIHVIEETRHVSYAREALARRLPRAGRLEREHARLVAAESAVMVGEFMANPAVYQRVGIADPVAARRMAKAQPASPGGEAAGGGEGGAVLRGVGVDGRADVEAVAEVWVRGLSVLQQQVATAASG